jgi:hypothetical protein
VNDDESVLVASPFTYVSPPMPPRDEVCNAKTTKAMAKIIEDVGTPDSVIRRLSFMNPMSSSECMFSSSVESPAQVRTVTKSRKVTTSEEDFMFPLATPPNVSDVSCDQNTSGESEGCGRFSLSLLNAAGSPKQAPSRRSLEGPSELSVLPPLLTNCPHCGKQFISNQHLDDHVSFCRPARVLCQRHSSDSTFTDSPAMPLQIQRAINTGLPPVAPLPLSPSILSSPPEDNFLEDEISTFLECLRSDAKRRVEHSLQVSSDDDETTVVENDSFRKIQTGLVLVPSRQPSPPPLLSATSNMSMTSPIPQRSSFENDQSLICLLEGSEKPSSPRFGGTRTSVEDNIIERAPCSSCGRKFANPTRLEKHEKICKQVFKQPKLVAPTHTNSSTLSESVSTPRKTFSCTFCQRSFDCDDKHRRHESVCVSVFSRSGRRTRSMTRSPRKSAARKNSSLRVISSQKVTIPPPVVPKLSTQNFSNACIHPGLSLESAVSASFSFSKPYNHISSSSIQTAVSTESIGRSSLELQYNMLREQIRSCSARLRQRRDIDDPILRGA